MGEEKQMDPAAEGCVALLLRILLVFFLNEFQLLYDRMTHESSWSVTESGTNKKQVDARFSKVFTTFIVQKKKKKWKFSVPNP